MDILPIPNADPEVTEEAGSAVAAVGFARPFVSSEFLELTQAVRKQHVRQLLISKARHVVWVLQLQLCLRWAGQPAGGRRVSAVLTGSNWRLFSWFSSGAGKTEQEDTV